MEITGNGGHFETPNFDDSHRPTDTPGDLSRPRIELPYDEYINEESEYPEIVASEDRGRSGPVVEVELDENPPGFPVNTEDELPDQTPIEKAPEVAVVDGDDQPEQGPVLESTEVQTAEAETTEELSSRVDAAYKHRALPT